MSININFTDRMHRLRSVNEPWNSIEIRSGHKYCPSQGVVLYPISHLHGLLLFWRAYPRRESSRTHTAFFTTANDDHKFIATTGIRATIIRIRRKRLNRVFVVIVSRESVIDNHRTSLRSDRCVVGNGLVLRQQHHFHGLIVNRCHFEELVKRIQDRHRDAVNYYRKEN
jgi:hypothetical protein